jgi:hypothetical protein
MTMSHERFNVYICIITRFPLSDLPLLVRVNL